MSYTKADKARIDKFRHIGCIVSGSPSYDVHHLTSGGRRLGNKYTIPLHPWYHRGVPFEGMSQKQTEEKYGPSLAKNKADFELYFGHEDSLLARVNELIGEANA